MFRKFRTSQLRGINIGEVTSTASHAHMKVSASLGACITLYLWQFRVYSSAHWPPSECSTQAICLFFLKENLHPSLFMCFPENNRAFLLLKSCFVHPPRRWEVKRQTVQVLVFWPVAHEVKQHNPQGKGTLGRMAVTFKVKY